jgi:uncharacterized protein with PIN domain/sulfur carrier protein ThiS
MPEACFRFYASLNDFLPPQWQQSPCCRRLKERGSVKDAIEALGVPHPEVAVILANGQPVDFSYLVGDGDRISVYPAFASLDVSSLSSLRLPLAEVRFIIDIHLGKLATYLRLLGFDTLYRNDWGDEELAQISSREDRLLLTRDRGLLKRSIVIYGYCVRQDRAEAQLPEVLGRFDLWRRIRPFQRCLRCNGLVEPVAKAAIEPRLLPKTHRYYEEFHICRSCDRLYWQGSHYQRLQALVASLLAQIPPPATNIQNS